MSNKELIETLNKAAEANRDNLPLDRKSTRLNSTH